MGWYAFFCELEYFWHHEETEVHYLMLIDQVQFFIDTTTIEDGGEHYRGAFPRDAVDREEMYLHQLWCEIA